MVENKSAKVNAAAGKILCTSGAQKQFFARIPKK
jgi:hypothetical protein